MMSNTKFICDFCGSHEGINAYKAKNSFRGMVVVVCAECGLVQSVEHGGEERKFLQTLSCDADWGNVRHGKGARFNATLKYLEDVISWDSVKKVLDVGSNRGNFVMWLASTQNSVNTIHAVEPDLKVVDEYRDNPSITLDLQRLENVQLESNYYDFIYNCHSLEHASSAMEMLRQMYSALVPGGVAFVEVPNIDAIADKNIVEEYFIDKHLFHFDRSILISMVKLAGYEVIKGNNDDDSLNLTLVLRKPAEVSEEDKKQQKSSSHARRNVEMITKYKKTLFSNRELLKRVVDEKIKPLALRQKLAFWGAGRIFDALVNYGELKPEHVHCLVDKFLYDKRDNSCGIKIHRPEFLKEASPHICIVLARSSEDEIAQNAFRYGVRHIIKFSSLMEQGR